MDQPPSGTVTFLFTDIEGSTRLWQQYPDSMDEALRCHNDLLKASIASHVGYVFQIIGDEICAAFSTAEDGVAAAIEAQRALISNKWGESGTIRVRMALHTGKAEVQPGEYTSGEYVSGLTLSRTARLLTAGHGGQILISLATADMIRDHLPQGITLRDLGARRLKDLIHPEQIFQVISPDLPADFPPLKTLDVHPHNLPVQLTSFIGRVHEMGEIKRLLKCNHLLTLTGIGGTGKTRLALQVAADLIDEYPGGIWLSGLAPLRDPALVERTVAQVLGVHEASSGALSDLLVTDMRDKHLLLILDNCEHVLEAAARLADLLLHKVPELNILATSRTHLNVEGEITYPIAPLKLPDLLRIAPLNILSQNESVHLFIERAKAAQPSFALTHENAPFIAQICSHLDGIPLAIELAAARTRHFSPDQISARLADRFDLLTGGGRPALARQQTLRAAMDWSYNLLNPQECTLFQKLSVFPASFPLEAAEAVLEDGTSSKSYPTETAEMPVLDLLVSLVDHSLVNVQEKNSVYRYSLLETVRQYALEKLQASGELSILQDRHLSYYLEMAEKGSHFVDIGHPVWMERFETEYENLRAAMEYAISAHPELAIRFEYPLSWFCEFTSRTRESYGWAVRLLDLTKTWPSGKLRAMALWQAGNNAATIGEFQHAQEWMESGLEMAREDGDKDLVKDILHDLAVLKYFQGDTEQLRIYSEAYLQLAQERNDKAGMAGGFFFLGAVAFFSAEDQIGYRYFDQVLEIARRENFPYNIAGALLYLGQRAHLEGDITKATIMYTECAVNYRLIGYRSALAWTLYRWGQATLQAGHSVQASDLFEESSTIYSELRDREGQENYLAGMAGVAAQTGQDELAARLFGADHSMLEKFEIKMSDLSHKVYDPLLKKVHDHLGDDKFNALWTEGCQFTLEQALDLALTAKPIS